MAMGKGLIKEEHLIKITPLAGGGIYAGMQGSLSLLHAHSKHLQDHNPIWTHPKARTGSPEEDLLTMLTSIGDAAGINSLQRCFVLQILKDKICFITAHWGANYYAAV